MRSGAVLLPLPCFALRLDAAQRLPECPATEPDFDHQLERVRPEKVWITLTEAR